MNKDLQIAFPDQHIQLAQMQNANGDWVAPTSDAITKAIAAGGAEPLYALTHPVPDAYPLAWVDNLYAPAHGLSIQKTEALATLIRYLATTGQEKAASVNEGRLSDDLVKQALAAADQLVEGNCVGADREIVASADPGPTAPASAAAMRAIGNALHCEPKPGVPQTTTTTTLPLIAPPPVTPAVTPSLGNDTGSTSLATDSSGVTNTSGSDTTPATSASTDTGSPNAVDRGGGPVVVVKKHSAELVTVSHLPFPSPVGASGTDRLATFLLGVFLFLLLRKPVARYAAKVRV
jgi:hypothetical protein